MSDRPRILVVDSGLCVHVAEALAAEGNDVVYFSEWQHGLPTSDRGLIGSGLPGIERAESLWRSLDGVSAVVFTDVYHGDLHGWLRERGVPVWGCAGADWLELDRVRLKEFMREHDLASPRTWLVTGTDALREHLEEQDDLWVKGTKYRGDFETFHHEKWKTTEPWLADLASRLGPKKDLTEFVVEEPIEGVELGFDGYTVDGELPDVGMWGYEVKDAGYVGKVVEDGEYPGPLLDVHAKIGPVLRAANARCFYSFEVRTGDGLVPYLVDPCLRCGSPPSECYVDVFENWTDVVLAGAVGSMVPLRPRARYAAQIILKSDWAEDRFLAVDYPEEVQDRVKLHNKCMIDGQVYVAPLGFAEVGSAVGIGDTLRDACEQALDVASKVSAYRLTYDEGVLDKAIDVIEEGKEYGIAW